MEYNPRTPHQGGHKAFKELTFKEQALSINGTLANLERAIRYHAQFGAKHATRPEKVTREKCVRQVERLADRLKR